MIPRRSLLLLLAALLALLAQPAALAAGAQPPTAAANSAQPCSSGCADMPGDCGKSRSPCDSMPSCLATASCGMAVAMAVEPAASPAPDCEGAMSLEVWSVFAMLHGRSIKPEIHPPSPLDLQA